MERLLNWSKKIKKAYPRLRFAVGILLVLIGIFAFVTPLTPGSWLAIIGLELLGVRIIFWLSKFAGKKRAGG